jgi:hypothetical protein
VIFLRRDNEINDKLTQRVYSVVEKPKYRKVPILSKELVFFGPAEVFKAVLRSFPALRFKRFIDSSREREKLLPFLEIQTEVVVSSVRICPCQEQYIHQTIRCKVVHIVSKANTVKTFERRESHPSCER